MVHKRIRKTDRIMTGRAIPTGVSMYRCIRHTYGTQRGVCSTAVMARRAIPGDIPVRKDGWRKGAYLMTQITILAGR